MVGKKKTETRFWLIRKLHRLSRANLHSHHASWLVLGLGILSIVLATTQLSDATEPPVVDGNQGASDVAPAVTKIRAQLVDTDTEGALIGKTPLTITIQRVNLTTFQFRTESTVSLTTNDKGRFSVTIPRGTDPDERWYLKLNCDHLLVPDFYDDEQGDERVSLLCLRAQMRRSRVLDSQEKPVSDAKVTVTFPSDWMRSATTDNDGHFELPVPIKYDYGIVVESNAGAYHRAVILGSADRIPEIRLAKGTVVRGQLIDADGEPIARCAVAIEDDDSQAIDTELTISSNGSLDIEKWTMTDAEGRFEFPPLKGQFVIYLGVPDEHFSAGTGEFVGAIDPPPFAPMSIRLDDTGERPLTLSAAKPVSITGSIKDADGNPIGDVSLKLQHPPIMGMQYFALRNTKTDENGDYELIVPATMKKVEISAYGKSIDGESWQAWSAEPYTNPKHWHAGRYRIGDFDGKPKTIDWVFAPQNKTPDYVRLAKARAERSPDVHPALRLIESQIESFSSRNEDPREKLMELCFKVESQNRGTRVGLGALHYVMRAAETSMHPVPTKARVKAIDVLQQQYLDHADLDLMIIGFRFGSPPPNAEAMLRAVIAKSPHDRVRGQAMYELASNMLHQMSYLPLIKGHRESLERLLLDQTDEKARASMKAEIERVKEFEAQFDEVGVGRVTSEAIQWLDDVVANYQHVQPLTRHWVGPASVRLIDITDHRLQSETTIAQWAAAMRFQLRDLKLGQQAPSLSGQDLYHNAVGLEDYRGRVVVLTVSDSGDETEMYASCNALLKKYAGQPLTVLSVVPADGGGGDSVRDIVRRCQITWPIIRDTENGDLARKWCHDTYCETYVIDQQGIIRDHASGESFGATAGAVIAGLLGDASAVK